MSFETETTETTESKEKKTSDIDDIQEAMDDYLKKSADFIQSNAENQDVTLKPSLSVSELQMVEATSISLPSTHSNNKRFYQFVLIAVMIGSLSIFIALIFNYFEMKRRTAHHETYYKYLQKAVEIKQQKPNETMLSVCHSAINDKNVESIYKARNIELSHLQVDIEELQKQNHTQHNKKSNKKYELIIMCDIELRLMMNAIKEDQAEFQRISKVKQWSKQHDDAYFKFLHKAILFQQQNPQKDTIVACHSAIHDVDIASLYTSLIDDMDKLHVNIKELKKKLQRKGSKPLNKKEELILICGRELISRNNIIEYEIQNKLKLPQILPK